MRIQEIQKMILSGLFLSLALVLPFFTGSIQALGASFLPMHLPIILCGFICGPKYGGLIGFISPLLRSLLFSMPPLYPVAIAMSFELATYGFITGLLYILLNKNIFTIYFSLIIAMVGGRIVLGIANVILLGLEGVSYSFATFISAAFIVAFPGIIFQLIVVPIIIYALQKAHQQNRFST
ncbi:MAG: ECF transporter S component [Candidatus Izemoplasmatales bacterium]